MKVNIQHCKVGDIYHMTGIKKLEGHFFVYIGRDHANGLYHFRMITSCNTPEKEERYLKKKKHQPGTTVALDKDSASCLTHESYIDIKFDIKLPLAELKMKFNARIATCKGPLRKSEFEELITRLNAHATPASVVRQSAMYNSIHAL